MLKKYLWKKAIKKACSATEGLEDTFANYLTKSPGVKRYFRLLTKANTSNNLYRNFVITIAFELYMCKRKELRSLFPDICILAVTQTKTGLKFIT